MYNNIVSCPLEAETAAVSSTQNVKIVAIDGVLTKVTSGGTQSAASTKERLRCSGHGTCMTLREAGRSFNGLYVASSLSFRYKLHC